jgi:hypothetical protein
MRKILNGYSHDDLASNMVQVVDKGQAAFLGAYSTMQYVTKVTDEIGRPGGLVSVHILFLPLRKWATDWTCSSISWSETLESHPRNRPRHGRFPSFRLASKGVTRRAVQVMKTSKT